MLLFAASWSSVAIRLNEPVKGTMKASIVQGNIRQDVKFDEAYKAATIRKYFGLTLAAPPVPTSSYGPRPQCLSSLLEDEARRAIRALPAALSSDLLLGTISRDRRGRYYNAAYVIGKRG